MAHPKAHFGATMGSPKAAASKSNALRVRLVHPDMADASVLRVVFE
jgi:hypothetical protein